jgi:hypothetical protein
MLIRVGNVNATHFGSQRIPFNFCPKNMRAVDLKSSRGLGVSQDTIALIDEAAVFGVFDDIDGCRF